MANGESQGKSIALFVFVSLTAITGLSAYYFYEKVERLNQTKTEAEANASEASKQKSQLDGSYNELVERVMGAGERGHDEVMTAVNADLSTPKTNDTRRQSRPKYLSYTDAVNYLSGELQESDRRKLALLEDISVLEAKLAEMQNRYQLTVDEAADAKTKKEMELAAETEKLQALVALKQEEITQYQRRFNEAQADYFQEQRDMEGDRVDFEKKIDEERRIIEDRSRAEHQRIQMQFERPDGAIVQTIPSLGQAYIDLGFEDGLFTGLTFSVFDSSTGGSPYALPKASIEVVRVGPRRSLAKVTNESNLRPLLSGDLIFNPIWSANQTAGIAFVGLMYVDDDNVPDNEFFANLIRQQGGRIDAQVLDPNTGVISGQVDVNTSWLVLGEIPEASESIYEQEATRQNAALTTATSTLRRQAQDNTVRVINLRNFLTFMGLDTPQRTVVAGDEERFYFGKRRPRLVDEAPKSAAESTN